MISFLIHELILVLKNIPSPHLNLVKLFMFLTSYSQNLLSIQDSHLISLNDIFHMISHVMDYY